MKTIVAEALQCPTLLNNGYGGHRIEGIGDKHIPWIHDTKSTDFVVAVDDEVTMRLMRMFNEPKGKERLKKKGIDPKVVDSLYDLGISSIGNLVAAIKFAKYNELTENDVVTTVFTDSMDMYQSRRKEQTDKYGEYTDANFERDEQLVADISYDDVLELRYTDKKRIHHLKYYTWIEQQKRELDELNAQWFDHDNYWGNIFKTAPKIDELINEFNKEVGLV